MPNGNNIYKELVSVEIYDDERWFRYDDRAIERIQNAIFNYVVKEANIQYEKLLDKQTLKSLPKKEKFLKKEVDFFTGFAIAFLANRLKDDLYNREHFRGIVLGESSNPVESTEYVYDFDKNQESNIQQKKCAEAILKYHSDIYERFKEEIKNIASEFYDKYKKEVINKKLKNYRTEDYEL